MSALPGEPLPTLGITIPSLVVLLLGLLVPGNALAQEPTTCSPVLVVHTPAVSEGEVRAVAITAQAIDSEDEEAWVTVAWEAAAGVELSAVTLLGTDGVTREQTEDLAQGAAQDVAGIWFCGTIEPGTFPDEDDPPIEGEDPGDPGSDADAGTDPSENEDPAPADEGSTPPDQEPGPPEEQQEPIEPEPAEPSEPSEPSEPEPAEPSEPIEPDPAEPSEPSEPDPASDGDEPAPPADALVEPSEPTVAPGSGTQDDASGAEDGAVAPEEEAVAPTDDPGAISADAQAPEDEDLVGEDDDDGTPSTSGATEPAEDVEVLGVQLSQDDQAPGPNWPILLVMLGLGSLAVGAAFHLWRSWPSR